MRNRPRHERIALLIAALVGAAAAFTPIILLFGSRIDFGIVAISWVVAMVSWAVFRLAWRDG